MILKVLKALVYLLEDGGVLYWSENGGRWKEVPAGAKVPAADLRVLVMQGIDDGEIQSHVDAHRTAETAAHDGDTGPEPDESGTPTRSPRKPPRGRTESRKAG